jgi:hypothetical protein
MLNIHLGTTMKRTVRLAALSVAMIISASALASAQDGYRYYDRDDSRYEGSFRVARDFGFEDGSRVAREDMYKAKPFNPNPRGKYTHEDHGYRREYGDKFSYEEAYARAYQQGYERVFRRY